jgi:hypothetical protein
MRMVVALQIVTLKGKIVRRIETDFIGLVVFILSGLMGEWIKNFPHGQANGLKC